ncbi:hypothetical protein A4X13_0g9297, partial [Tilletia indica]
GSHPRASTEFHERAASIRREVQPLLSLPSPLQRHSTPAHIPASSSSTSALRIAAAPSYSQSVTQLTTAPSSPAPEYLSPELSLTIDAKTVTDRPGIALHDTSRLREGPANLTILLP